ncbi:hypothetical protein BCR33DRAFT_846496 [Rhizoclosmatium globosum]|uniref:Uncharacterized protein n=1 Tax=Rhizoclosmatium globosum TaxID=329046 RepID=A0A1Y2CUT9_9FUNG|nr:hypothetical protein BCR33DRAFT_846496 [Rhizoclosmatium globosum]|eukprot:ORY50783.1 hypothetical protein BCR33DRAFT_846496 [Rhizoclosmatium globosum]
MSEPRSVFFATPPPLPSPALPLTGPRAPTKAHPFFVVAANAARVPAPSPIRPSARRDPYPQYHAAHAQPQIRRAVQQRLSNTLTLLPPITRSEPFHSTLVRTLEYPFGLALLDSRITTKHKKPTPSPVALGIQAISLKAAIFRFIKPESQYGNRRLFLVTDRLQCNKTIAALSFLSYCANTGKWTNNYQFLHQFVILMWIDVGGVNGGYFEFELDSPDVGVPIRFIIPNSNNQRSATINS